jgi:general stress protein YciG
MNDKKIKKGFALMDPEKQKAAASKGGKSAHRQGKAHQFTTEEARAAGKIGGRARKLKHAAH